MKQTLGVVGNASYLELSRRGGSGIINTLLWRNKILKEESDMNP